MLNSFPLLSSRLAVLIALAAVTFVSIPTGVQAQQTITFSNGVPDDAAPMPVKCVRYLNARESEAVLPGASLAVRAGEIQILASGQIVFSIPAPATRAQLMRQNGQRPGADYQYSTDRASTGDGIYWFETQYSETSEVPEVFRNELFIDSAGKLVSYTFVEKRRIANAETGAREATIRCEP